MKNRVLVAQLQQELLGQDTKRLLIIKTHTDNLSRFGEISFPFDIIAWKGVIWEQIGGIKNQNILEYYLKRKDCDPAGLSDDDIVKKSSEFLVSASQAWCITLKQCSLQKSRVCLFIDRNSVIGYVIKQAIRLSCNYGRSEPKRESISLKVSKDPLSEMTTARLHLIKEASQNLLMINGNKVVEDTADHQYLLTTKSVEKTEDSYRRYVCGVVKSRDSRRKETLNFEIWLDKIHCGLSDIMTSRGSSSIDRMENLTKILLVYEFLSLKPSRPVFIKLGADNVATITSSKDGPFVLYNATRMIAIIEKFKKEYWNIYARLLDLEDVNFDLLNQEEEWDLVFNFVLGYPEVIENCVRYEPEIELCPQVLCQFLTRLSSKFSLYYRRTRILTEGRDHLIPVMIARLNLLRALLVVTSNALAIFDITPFQRM